MLTFEHLTITHKKDNAVLINDLTMTINACDKVAIIGEEGCGKSTLLSFMREESAISSYAEVSGICRRNYRRVAYLPPFIDPTLLTLSISDFIDRSIDYTAFDYGLFYQLAHELGFDSKRFEDESPLAVLSGGEKFKLQLLLLLAHEPDCLLLDEPTSDLDFETITWLIGFIQKSMLTIIFVSHDDYFLSQTATRIIHLEQVKKRRESKTHTSKMGYKDYLDNRKKNFHHQERLATEQERQYQKDMTKLNRTMSAVHHALNTTKDSTAGRLLAKKMKNLKSRQKRLEREKDDFYNKPASTEAIELVFSAVEPLPKTKQLLSYDQHKLSSGQVIDLHIWGQDKIVITGKNGIGKTLLLKDIRNQLTQKGYTVSYMPQDYLEELDENKTALDFLERTRRRAEARTLLAKLQFTPQEIQHPISNLSSGQKAKLFFCRMVLDEAQILLLDEPTRHLSPLSQPEIRQLFRNYTGCIIAVSHDYHFIHEVGDSIYQLTQNELTLLAGKP